jgi:hypothetical protein
MGSHAVFDMANPPAGSPVNFARHQRKLDSDIYIRSETTSAGGDSRPSTPEDNRHGYESTVQTNEMLPLSNVQDWEAISSNRELLAQYAFEATQVSDSELGSALKGLSSASTVKLLRAISVVARQKREMLASSQDPAGQPPRREMFGNAVTQATEVSHRDSKIALRAEPQLDRCKLQSTLAAFLR